MPRELRDNPRVILWESQDEKWAGKNLPENVRAIFTTRWIGHATFRTIMLEARKKKITIFPCEGTGQIVKMITELITVPSPVVTTIENGVNMSSERGKLIPLVAYIDPAKSAKENTQILVDKAKELNIDTTAASVANLVWRKTTVANRKTEKKEEVVENIKKELVEKPKSETRTVTSPTLDATVEMLDSMIQRMTDMRQEMVDMRDFLVAVTEENANLKKRIERFKKYLDTGEE